MNEKDQAEDKVPFPAGFPKPHELEEWARSTKTQFLAAGVAEVSQEMIPEGKFDYLFPQSMLEPPPKLPKDASWSETMKHRQMRDDIERRRLHNGHVEKKRDEWFNEGNNTVFHIVTDSMIHTAPGLRKTLKDKHVCSDGRYDGVKAAKDVAAWLERLKVAYPQEDYYDAALAAVKKKRLPAGCSEKTFQAVLRKVRFDINPYTTTPYEGEKLGRFIIRKLLPPYTDAAESLEARLIAKGELGDIEKVGRHRRSLPHLSQQRDEDPHGESPGLLRLDSRFISRLRRQGSRRQETKYAPPPGPRSSPLPLPCFNPVSMRVRIKLYRCGMR
jgi:hypothetical protein